MPYNALQIPPSAQGKDGLEVLRAAVIEGGLHVTLRRAFEDPRAWGMLLADVAQQVAQAYAQEDGRTIDDVVVQIREGFSGELDAPLNVGTISPIE